MRGSASREEDSGTGAEDGASVIPPEAGASEAGTEDCPGRVGGASPGAGVTFRRSLVAGGGAVPTEENVNNGDFVVSSDFRASGSALVGDGGGEDGGGGASSSEAGRSDSEPAGDEPGAAGLTTLATGGVRDADGDRFAGALMNGEAVFVDGAFSPELSLDESSGRPARAGSAGSGADAGSPAGLPDESLSFMNGR